MSTEQLDKSKKLNEMKKKWTVKPHVVSFDWLIDSLEAGEVKEVTEGDDGYLVDY